jgi:taurine dioxygenase
MNTAPLPVGVEVTGLELDRPIAPDVAVALRRLLAEHQLLVFKGQALAPQDQIRAMEIFGNVLDERGDGLRYQYVSGEKTSILPSRLLFHSDNHFTPVPLELLSLYGEDVGEKATPTLFADSVAGYGRLTPECRARLETLGVTNRSFFHLGLSCQPARELSPELEGGPVSHHPAIWRHPDTGAPFVYLTEMHAFRLDGLSREESDELLDEVIGALYDETAIYEHKWADGDLVIWNNRTVQHARGPIDGSDRSEDMARSIRRVSTGTITFSEQFQFSPEAVTAMEDFYQRQTAGN